MNCISVLSGFGRFAAVMAVVSLVLLLPTDADAAFDPIPDDDEFVPFMCGDEPAWDPYRDASGGTDHRDPVGDAERPAALRTADDDYLYLRMRLDGDPRRDDDSLRSFGWGYLFDAPPSNFDDDDPATNTYDFLLHLEGGGGTDGTLRFRSNEGQEETDDPTVPAAGDLMWETEHNDPDPIWHVKEAPEEPVGSEPSDWWLTVAVPWDDLEPHGITPDGIAIVWMGSSNSNQAINVDFICHDGDVDPTPDMSSIGTDDEPLDPSYIDDDNGNNGDGDNGDPDDPDMPGEDGDIDGYSVTGGGPVCSSSTGTTGAAVVITLIALSLVALRRRSYPLHT